MGGSTVSDALDTVKSVGTDTVKVASSGTVDLENNKVSFNPSTMLENVTEGVTRKSATEKGIEMSTPDIKMPKAPTAVDEDKAAADAKRKAEKIGKGGASTILGGSIGDGSNILKKKLLGQ